MIVDYLERYGVERPRTNDVAPLGLLAEPVAAVVLESYRRAEIARLDRKALAGAGDADLFAQYENWKLWVRIGHLLQFDPGPFAPL